MKRGNVLAIGLGVSASMVGGALFSIYTSSVIQLARAPTRSLLQRRVAKYGIYGDAFAVRASVGGRLGTAAPEEVLKLYMDSFFTSPVFKLERFILRLARQGRPVTDSDIRSYEYEKGDAVQVFTVVETTHTEALFCWDEKLHGYTWFAVQRAGQQPALTEEVGVSEGSGEVVLLFGSALKGGGADEVNGAMSLFWRTALAFHVAYSRLLLAAALRRFERRQSNTSR
eukprot:comp70918_c0_seq1/m.48123 comp70918_c0_seq1/g.48123  ORF comp70918_c0_seq1/g.48123 comp70918_c0_seq1/m.48123 type:complete len:227 (-) comp70918_c0_seq1:452-1132(-)